MQARELPRTQLFKTKAPDRVQGPIGLFVLAS